MLDFNLKAAERNNLLMSVWKYDQKGIFCKMARPDSSYISLMKFLCHLPSRRRQLKFGVFLPESESKRER